MRQTGMRVGVGLVIGVLVASSLVSAAGAERPGERKGSGEPVEIAVLGSFTDPTLGVDVTEWASAVKARVAELNKEGGIGDRRIKVFVCDVMADPNRAENCAREAVERGVVAAVGLVATTGDIIYPIFEEAGIPVIGSMPAGPTDYMSPVSFPFTAGVLGQLEGLPIALAQQSATKQEGLSSDVGGATNAAVQLAVDAVAQRNGYDVELEIIPPDQADFAPIVAAATADDPEGIFFIIPGSSGKFVQTLRQSGYEEPIATISLVVGPDLIDELGDAAEDMLVVEQVRWRDSKNGKQFQKEMKKHAPKKPITGIAAGYWLAAWVFGELAQQIVEDGGTVDSATLTAAVQGMQDFDTRGMTPPITMSTPVEVEFPIPLTRLFNPTVIVYEVNDKGKLLEVDGEFINPFEPQ